MKRWVLSSILLMLPLSVFAETAVGINPKDALMTSIFTALAGIVVSLMGYLGKLLGRLLKKKIDDIDNDALQKTAYVAVRFVNDAFKKATGKEKYKIACERVAKKLPGLDGEDIEAAVRAMYTNMNAEIPKN